VSQSFTGAKTKKLYMSKKAVILLSGGLDSTTLGALAKGEGYSLYALSFAYGQRHGIELARAAEQAEWLGVEEHKILDIDLRAFGGSALTDDIEVPKNTHVKEIGKSIPITYVPARNTIFLSFALGYAESIGTGEIFIGVNALDYSGYPDCRPEFIESFEQTANLATAAGVEGKKIKIHTPLINLSKADIIRKGLAFGVDYSKTISCYDPSQSGEACGECEACILRRAGFERNRITDPAIYAAAPLNKKTA